MSIELSQNAKVSQRDRKETGLKKPRSMAVIVATMAVVLLVMAGLFFGLENRESNSKSTMASPYGMPTSGAGFKRPTSPGSGVNAITGEPLSNSAKEYEAAALQGASKSK